MKFISNARYNEPIESGSIFKAKIGRMTITVHEIIHCEGWFFSCREIGVEDKELAATTFTDAAKEAQMLAKRYLLSMTADIQKACEEKIEISRY